MTQNASLPIVLLFILSLGSFAVQALGEDIRYRMIADIPYNDTSGAKEDPYIAERCKLDLYYPENVENFATVVWFHGGSLKRGNKQIPSALKEQGFAVIAVNYRLNPKAKAPAYIQDAAASVAWAFKNIGTYGGDARKIFVSGHSAGGYLAAMVGLDKRWLDAHGIDANNIAGLIPFSGQMVTHSTVREEMGIDKIQVIVNDLAPLFHVRKDASPLLLITGDRNLEIIARHEENALLLSMMKGYGHPDARIYEIGGWGHGMTHPAYPILAQEIRRRSKAIDEAHSDQ